MKRYRALTDNDGTMTYVVWCDVPTGQNKASKTWKDCLAEDTSESAVRARTSMLPASSEPGGVSADVEGMMATGDVVEWDGSVYSNPERGAGTRQTELEAAVDELIARIPDEIRERYDPWGFEADRP